MSKNEQMKWRQWPRLALTGAALLPTVSAIAAPTAGNGPLFPDNAVFNTRIDDCGRFPTHPPSATWVAQVGSKRPLHLDWGRNENEQQWQDYYGIPFNVVDGTALGTLWPNVNFDITDPRAGNSDGELSESDSGVALVFTHVLATDGTNYPGAGGRPTDNRWDGLDPSWWGRLQRWRVTAGNDGASDKSLRDVTCCDEVGTFVHKCIKCHGVS